MLHLIAVGLGGLAGAIARYGISNFVNRKMGAGMPLGTLAVNLIGCFAAGLLITLAAERNLFSEQTRLFLITGFMGSLTTFSTFGYETLFLARDGAADAALFNVALNVVLGVCCVWGGMSCARIIQG
jgi:CrcB protein